MTRFEPLESHTVVPYMLKRGLVAPADVAEGITVEDLSRRNRGFRVRLGGRGFLVKQILRRDDAIARRSLAREGRTLAMIQEAPAFQRVRRAVPSLVDHDPHNDTLVTQLITPATSLTKLVVNLGDIDWNLAAFDSAGRTLAAFHEQAKNHLAPDVERMPLEYPNPLRLRECLRSSIRSGAAWAATLLDALDFMPWDDLPKMVEHWNESRAAFHGDVRWDNLLVTYGRPSHGQYPMHLIDWEFTGRGDPHWDVACFLGEFLRFRTLTASVHGPKTVEDVHRLAAVAVEDGHGAARAFLAGYAEEAGRDEADVLAATRPYLHWVLAVMSWEVACNAARAGSADLPPESDVLVEAARVFLQDPAASKEWFDA